MEMLFYFFIFFSKQQAALAFMCVMCLRRYCGRSVGLLSAAKTIDFQFVDTSELANDTHNLLLKEQNMNMIEMIILTKVWK